MEVHGADEPDDDVSGDVIVGSEVLHLRNFDSQQSHTVEVAIHDERGESVLEEQYLLSPEQLESEFGVLSAGTYVVEVWCDGVRGDRRRCQIDDRPEKTAVIDLGNGVVSITEGLY